MSSDSISSYIQVLGLSAAVGGGIGGGISALLNYLLNIRDFNKKNKIRLIEEKIELYSYLIFQLDRMRFAWHAFELMEGRKPQESDIEHFVIRSGEEKAMINEMSRRIEKGYHLFKQDILKDWAYLDNLFYHPAAEPKIPAFRKNLIDEYNNKIIPEYQKLTGNELELKL
jgi:hypothetical protein